MIMNSPILRIFFFFWKKKQVIFIDNNEMMGNAWVTHLNDILPTKIIVSSNELDNHLTGLLSPFSDSNGGNMCALTSWLYRKQVAMAKNISLFSFPHVLMIFLFYFIYTLQLFNLFNLKFTWVVPHHLKTYIFYIKIISTN